MAENLNLKSIVTVDTRPFKKLVMTIGELPTSFVESMTYYELLAWFVNYLETVIIPTVNNNGETVEELQNRFIDLTKLFEELEDFIENYFDNLDVQEEINNKLDQMVIDGTLPEIITTYIQANVTWTFDTVADMKLATNLINGSYAQTLGFYSISDGGKAIYKIREKEQSDVIDERFLIAIGSNLVGELVHGQEINVLQMGVTDTNLASIINSLLENDYYVYIPRGNYNITETVRFTKQYQKLVSDGRLSCTASPAFKVESYYGEFKFNNRCFTDLPDMTFIEIGSSESNSFNNDIFINALFDFSIGIKFNPSNNKGCGYNNIKFNYIKATTHGILITTGDGVNYVNENYFQGGYIRAEGMESVIKMIKGNDQIDVFNGNVFEHIGMEGEYEIGIDLDFASYNQFENIRLSENTKTGEWYYVVTGNGSSNNNFSNKSRMPLDKIKDENTISYTNANYYRMVCSNSTDDTVGKSFYTIAGKKLIKRCDTQNGLGKTILSFPQDTTTYENEPEYYVDDGTIVALGHTPDNSSLEYTLPEVFNLAGVSAFYLYVRDMGENNTMTIKQNNGNIVVTKDQLGSGRIYQKFFKIEFVGQITGNRWKVTQLS